MSSNERRLTSWALSLFNSLEENTQTRARVLVAACGLLATIGMWIVHLSYPYIFQMLFQNGRTELLFLFAGVITPPFAVAFSIGSLITRQTNESFKGESGPMSGYFYRESADKRWKLLIVAGIIAAMNFLFMLVTSDPQ